MTEEKKQIIQNLMLTVAMLILLVCAAIPILTDWDPAKLIYLRWVYAFGAVMALAERMTERYKGKNTRIKRLYRIGKVSALFYCVSAFFLLWPVFDTSAGYDRRDWLAFLMAGAVLQIYVTFAYEHVVKKEKKKQERECQEKSDKK